MSGYANISAVPDQNILYNAASGLTASNVVHNQLLNQAEQQTIGGNEIEMMARAAGTLMDPTQYPTTEARAAAYPQLLGQLQRQGFAKNAPTTYPGDAQIAAVARLGTPSQTQQEWGFNRAANAAYNTAIGATAPSGTVTTAPASTAPASSGTIEPDALTRAQAIRDGLIKRGLDVDTATGFAANALHESGANPNVGPGDAGASHGAFQWRDQRYDRYPHIYGNSLDNAPLDQQLDYVMYELNTTEGAAWDRIAAAQGPAAKAAAISQYYLRPKDVQAEIARRSSTATQLASQWGGAGTSTGQPVITGDSLASQDGLGGTGVVGDSPAKVLARVQADSRAGKYNGQPVVLSTGASNDPTDLASVEQQIREAQGGNAGKITVLGVGPGVEAKAPGTNAKLQALAKSYGADFVPLPADQMSPDGVHPTAQGYAKLKAAVAPPQGAPGGVAARTGGVNVAGPGAGSGGPVAAPAATAQSQPQLPQPPQNQVMPGAPNGPPAVQPQSPAQPAPAGGPQPPQLAPLNARGLTPPQQAQINAMQLDPRFTIQQRVTAEQGFQNQNIQLQQKAFSDWIQVQQLQTSQGQLSVSQQNSALEYWKAAHPDAKVTMTGGEIVTQDPRTGQEIAPRIQVTPQRADTAAMAIVSRLGPKVANGTATPDEQAQYAVAVDSYRQPTLKENPVTKETVRVNTRELPAGFPEPPALGGGGPSGGVAGPGGSNVVMPGLSPAQQEIERDPAKAKVADMQYERNSKEIGAINDSVREAQANNIRVQEMRNILDNVSTGPGTGSRAQIAAWLQRWAPASLSGWTRDYGNLDGAAAVEAFTKLGLTGAGQQERSVLGNRGGYRAIEMFKAANPNVDLLNPANSSILATQLISNQANIDYAQAASKHFAEQEQRYGDTHKYTSLEQFDQQWNAQRNPQVFAAAMGAISGQPPDQWSKGLSDAEYNRALDIISRADPSAVVNARDGRRISMQPNGAPAPITVKTPADAATLAPGTPYVTPDGRKFVR